MALMKPLTEQEIRAAFVNCTKGEAKRLSVPRDLADHPGTTWTTSAGEIPSPRTRLPRPRTERPPEGPGPAQPQPHLLADPAQHVLDVPDHPHRRRLLMVAPKAGKAGQQGNSVGAYICSDLSCSLYVRGKKDAGAGARLHESLTLEEKIQRTVTNLTAFLTKVTA